MSFIRGSIVIIISVLGFIVKVKQHRASRVPGWCITSTCAGDAIHPVLRLVKGRQARLPGWVTSRNVAHSPVEKLVPVGRWCGSYPHLVGSLEFTQLHPQN